MRHRSAEDRLAYIAGGLILAALGIWLLVKAIWFMTIQLLILFALLVGVSLLIRLFHMLCTGVTNLLQRREHLTVLEQIGGDLDIQDDASVYPRLSEWEESEDVLDTPFPQRVAPKLFSKTDMR